MADDVFYAELSEFRWNLTEDGHTWAVVRATLVPQ